MNLIREVNNASEAVKSLLVGYHYAEAGQVCNVSIKQDTLVFKNILTGSFIVHYETHFFLGCSDKRYENQNVMKIEFAVSDDFNTIWLSGEVIPERTPDEY